MKYSIRSLLLTALPLVFASIVFSQPRGTSSISGLVSLDGKPSQGIVVVANPGTVDRFAKDSPPIKSLTDEGGRYKFLNLEAGNYSITAAAPGYVDARKDGNGSRQATISVAEGESADKIDFPLKRGGVITGRITNEQGKPIIDEGLALYRLGPGGSKVQDRRWFTTDDEGSYRIYGVEPGKYILGAGTDPKMGGSVLGEGSYDRVYYPGSSTEAEAGEITVTVERETTGINLVLKGRSKSFNVVGKVIDEETRKPVEAVMVMMIPIPETGVLAYVISEASNTDPKGNFQLVHLTDGKYGFQLEHEGEQGYYAEPQTFEIKSEDLTDVEIPLRRGADISGNIVITGVDEREARAKAPSIRVSYKSLDPNLPPWYFQLGAIPADSSGRFTLHGVRPGRVKLSANTQEKGLQLIRIERSGTPIDGSMEAKLGEPITDVKFVFSLGTGIIRGEIEFEGGDIPENIGFFITVSGPGGPVYGSELDSRGKFVIEGLSTGNYQVTVRSRKVRPDQDLPHFLIRPVTKSVDVTNGAESPMTIKVDLRSKESQP